MLKNDDLIPLGQSSINVAQASGSATAQRDAFDDSQSEKGIYEWAENNAWNSICENINSALRVARSPYPVVIYSEDATKRVFLSAWTLAAQLSHRVVTIDHLLFAMINEEPEIAKKLDESSSSSALAMQTGALVRLARLPKTKKPQMIDVLKPDDYIVKWLGEASRYIAAQAAGRELEPKDLVAVLHWTDIDSTIQGTLQQRLTLATTAGGLRSQMESTRQNIVNAGITANFHRSETKKAFSSVDGKLAELSTHVATGQDVNDNAQLSQITGHIAAIESSFGEVSTEILPGIAQLINQVDRRSSEIQNAQLVSLAEAVEKGNNQISDLDSQMASIKASVPPSPSGRRLLLAVVSVLVLGVAGGYALNNPSIVDKAITDVIHKLSISLG